MVNEKIIFVAEILKLLKNHDAIRNFLPYSQHEFFQVLTELDNKIKSKEGYNENGLKIFIDELNKLKLLEWKSEKWVEMHKEKESYLFDFFESLYLYLVYSKFKNFYKKNIFLYEKSNNKDFYSMLAEMKFSKEVLSNFFIFFDELSNKVSYIYFEALKTDDYSK